MVGIPLKKEKMLKRLCEREKIMQLVKKNVVEFISTEFGVCLLSSPSGSHLFFYQLRIQWWVIQLLAATRVPPSPASRGGFYCNQKGRAPGSPLGGTVQFSRKIVGVSPASTPSVLVCPSLFSLMYSF